MPRKVKEKETKKVVKATKKAAPKEEKKEVTEKPKPKHHRHSALSRVMNFFVSAYVYFVAFTLVVYMISTLVGSVLDFLTGLVDLADSPQGIMAAFEGGIVGVELLHTIAFTVVLVKAYKILIAFAETQHINLKLLVEIAIVAPTIEIIFNNSSYDYWVQILFAVFAVVNLTIYLIFYKTLKQVSHDYIEEFESTR